MRLKRLMELVRGENFACFFSGTEALLSGFQLPVLDSLILREEKCYRA